MSRFSHEFEDTLPNVAFPLHSVLKVVDVNEISECRLSRFIEIAIYWSTVIAEDLQVVLQLLCYVPVYWQQVARRFPGEHGRIVNVEDSLQLINGVWGIVHASPRSGQ